MAFKDVLKKQRQSGSGILSSVAGAAGAQAREALDIRNILFSKGSLLSALFPNVKGFKAGDKMAKPSSLVSEKSPTSVDLSDAKLDTINQNTKISAKNSMVLPSMARDMNVMRQNIVKMVKLSGGKPSTSADMFFMKASEREKSYESQIQGTKSLSPTNLSSNEDDKKSDKKGAGFKSLIAGFLLLLGIGIIALFKDLDLTKILLLGAAAVVGTVVFKSLLTAAVTAAFAAAATALGLKLPKTPPVPPTTKTTPPAVPGSARPGAPPSSPESGRRGRQRDPKTGRFTKATTTPTKEPNRWARFVMYVERVAPNVATKIGTRLAGMAGLALVPVVGWVLSAISFGLNIMLAIELYKLWKQFTAEEEGIDIGEDTKIPPISSESVTTEEAKLGAGEFAGMDMGVENIPTTSATTPAAQSSISQSTPDQMLLSPEENNSLPAPPAPPKPAAPPKAPASTKPTPASSSELGGIDYASYAKTMGQRESSGDYKKVNTLGFVGKYQFGSMALEDLKLVKSGVGAKGNSALDDPSNWTIDGGKEAFLNNSSLQEKAMVDYTKMMFKRIKKLKVIDDTTPPATIAGYLGAAHIGGQGGAADLKAGIVRQDAYGTKTSDYFKLASSTQGTSSSSTPMAAASPPKVSGAQIASASAAVDASRMQAMSTPAPVSAAPTTATQKTRSPQAQQITIPNTIDSDLFDALIARATEFS